MQYCPLQHQALLLLPVTPTTGYCFCLAPFLHSFWSYFSTDLQQHIGHLPTWGVLFQYPIILPFHSVHGVLKARILKWFAIPFSSGPHTVRPLHHDPTVLGGPTQHGLVLLSQTRLWSCDQIGQFSVIMVLVCLPSDALSQHLPSYLVFSYLGRGMSLYGCSSKVQSLLLTLDEGYLLMAAPSDLERVVAPLSPCAPMQPPLHLPTIQCFTMYYSAHEGFCLTTLF